jgi:CheY-like chemotaxis protein
VFDRFQQADPSTTRRHGGLGLGLAIVKTLVELHGGAVVARSDGAGHGATFVVSLPVTMPLPEEPSEPEPRRPRAVSGTPELSASATMLKGVKVLVVDDESDARALVKRLLEDCQATVITASSAAQAMEFLRNDPPAVLISDIGMPEEDGYALIRKVRALDKQRGSNTPALALTAYARSEDRMQAIRYGYQMHLAKPVEPAELTTVVAALAGRTAQMASLPDDSQNPAMTI